MSESDSAPSPWTASSSAKERTAIQRCVTALLDELAPERVLKRAEELKGEIEQHRTPSGCILQAPTAAISVSWFPDSGQDAKEGELHIVVWKGTVTRRGGTSKKPKAATLVEELVLNPMERTLTDCVWRGKDGKEYDTAALTARCLELLEKQLASG